MTDQEIKKAFSLFGISDPTTEEIQWYTDRMKSDPNQSDWYLSTIKQARHNNTGSQNNTNFQTSLERSKDQNLFKSRNYFHPILGAGERWRTSLDNGTNPINGLVNVSVPTLLLYGAIRNPVGTLGAIGGGFGLTTLGNVVTDSKSGGKYKSVAGLIQDKTGVSRLGAEFANPLTWIGGAKGYKLGTNFMNKLYSKFSTLLPKASTRFFYPKDQSATAISRTTEQVALPGNTRIALQESNTPLFLPESRFTALNTVREIGPSKTPIILQPKTATTGYQDYWLSSSQQTNPISIGVVKLGNQPSGNTLGKQTNNLTWYRKTYPGPMIKSLMEGNPLEKQLSKQGTISLNSLKAHIAKGNTMEKEVMNAALQQFKGQDKIDYNDFRKAVQDRLIRYQKTYVTKYEDYGADRLGIITPKTVAGYIIKDQDFHRKYKVSYGLLDDYGGGFGYRITDKETGQQYTLPDDHERFFEFVKNNAPDVYDRHKNLYDRVKFNTFIFSSNKIPKGSNKHYYYKTLGHSRTFIHPNEPDVLHIMESQSDWAQDQIGKVTMPLNAFKTNPNTGQPFTPEELPQFRSIMAQKNYLTDNYLQRQLQENLLYAAENELKKMRYPTPETAAVIEGYEKEAIENSELNQLYEKEMDIAQQIENLYDTLNDAYNEGDYEEFDLLTTEVNRLKNLLNKYQSRIKQLENDPSQYKYKPEYMTILKKYADFPKMYEKLYGKGTVRTVTDAKGNTWYEVDVPDNFLQREWQYKHGGKLKYYNK